MNVAYRPTIPFVLVAGLALGTPATAGDYQRRATRYEVDAPIVVVPYCTPKPPPFGLSCIPRALPPAPDSLIAVQESLQYSRRTLRRPYQQTFVWP